MNRPRASVAAVIIALIVVAASCTSLRSTPSKKPSAANRHACTYCHLREDPVADPALLVSEGDTAFICNSCHEFGNRHYPLHHPFGFTPRQGEFVNPDKAFPLFDNRLECMTCHAPHAGAEYTETPSLLRGGPYTDRRQICFRCHTNELYAKIDPHKMLDTAGKIRDVNGRPACLYCHAKIPQPETQQTEDVRFKADIGFLCWRCHPPMPGEFFHNHFLKKPIRQTRKQMRESEKQSDVILPIVPRNRVTCSTCHNPHQEGVILSSAAAKGADSKGKLRMPKEELCTACHGSR